MVEAAAGAAAAGVALAVATLGGAELGGPAHRVARAGKAAARLDGRAAALPAAAVMGGLVGWLLTGFPALALAGAALAAGGVGALLRLRADRRRMLRQDALLEAVRVLRQLLETGAIGVPGALTVLAQRGPEPLRGEFAILARAAGERGAWASARARLGEPVFDLLAAAILVQRPGGGALAPLFIQLEDSVTALYEVQREAVALGSQARSAAALILGLPVAFLLIMCMLRSPYLDVYRQPGGEIFLVAMLALMGVTHELIRRMLLLPEEPRLEMA
ncbi:MAG: hypothetical protein NVS9B1_17390 [Candidatus Dormibacteraceae bacterium]